MQYFEEKLIKAINNTKITCYCDTSYARLLYWEKQINIKGKILFNKYFLNELPDFYYLGFPIREIINGNNPQGHCHSCVLALSLCYKSFSIITCNLASYASYLNFIGETNDLTFEHSVLLVNDGKTVIDTSFGFITDFATYKDIFKINRVKNILSNDIKKTDPYVVLNNKKTTIGPSIDSELFLDEEYKRYIEEIKLFLSLCERYRGLNNLEYYYNNCIPFTSGLNVVDDWRNNISVNPIIDSKRKIKNR